MSPQLRHESLGHTPGLHKSSCSALLVSGVTAAKYGDSRVMTGCHFGGQVDSIVVRMVNRRLRPSHGAGNTPDPLGIAGGVIHPVPVITDRDHGHILGVNGVQTVPPIPGTFDDTLGPAPVHAVIRMGHQDA